MTQHSGEGWRVGENEDGTLDEVCVETPKFVHLEQMDVGHWWLRIDFREGYAIVVDLTTPSHSRAKVNGRWEWDGSPS